MRKALLALLLLTCLPLTPVAKEEQKQTPLGIVLTAGTPLQVRMDQAVDTARNRTGDRFVASLHAPVVVDNKVVMPKGTAFRGHVTGAKPSGRLRGRGHLGVTLDSFTLNGKTYHISTSRWAKMTDSHRKRNLAWIAGGSSGGALIGGLAAGGPWALAGAGIGAGAGTAVAAFTGKRNVQLPAESVVSFSLKRPVALGGRS